MGTKLSAPARGDFEAALTSEDPYRALRSSVKELSARGYSREAILGLLQEFRESLQLERREPEEDLVLEVMDDLVGWTSPHLAL
jgi:hypothetical protein